MEAGVGHALGDFVGRGPADCLRVVATVLHVLEGVGQLGDVRLSCQAVEHGDHHGPVHGGAGAEAGVAHADHQVLVQHIVHPGVIPRGLGQVLEGQGGTGGVVLDPAVHGKVRARHLGAVALQLLGGHLEGVAAGVACQGQGQGCGFGRHVLGADPGQGELAGLYGVDVPQDRIAEAGCSFQQLQLLRVGHQDFSVGGHGMQHQRQFHAGLQGPGAAGHGLWRRRQDAGGEQQADCQQHTEKAHFHRFIILSRPGHGPRARCVLRLRILGDRGLVHLKLRRLHGQKTRLLCQLRQLPTPDPGLCGVVHKDTGEGGLASAK